MITNGSPAGRRWRAALAGTAAAAIITGTAATCAVPALAAAAPAAAELGSTPQLRAQLARLAQQEVRAGAPGVIVRVSDGRGPAITVARQARWTRADGQLTASGEFRMGSNTKTMIATLALQLVAEHKLTLTDPVSSWLPGLIPNGHAITLRMLLNHTSGLFNDIFDPGVLAAFTGQDPRHWTPRQLIAAAVSHPPLFAPGTAYSYSNTNYIALGLVLEKATGQSLARLIQQRIARPLHLHHTYLPAFASRPGIGARLADGYEPDKAHLAPLLPPGTPKWVAFVGPARGGAWVDTTRVNNSTEWAAGGIVSTAGDWARFQSALLAGKLLPPAQLKEMRTTVLEDPAAPHGNRYGLGLEQVVTPCGTVWGHDGQVPGYSSWDYTNNTGSRTVSVFASTMFGLYVPAASAARQILLDTSVCDMLG
jgi:D-alanyl-D-alanine carboxypeptidase